MNQSDEFFKGLGNQALKSFFDKSGDKKQRSEDAEQKLMLALLGIVAFVGAEGVRIVFRKNFGSMGISLLRLVLFFISFIGISLICVGFAFDDSANKLPGTVLSFFVTAIVMIFIAFYVLIKGLSERKKAVQSLNITSYRGDSDRLSFLLKEGWKPGIVKNFGEPFTVLLVGVCFFFFNIIGGLAIALCALSYWANIAIEFLFVGKPLHEEVESMHRNFKENNQFTEVKSN